MKRIEIEGIPIEIEKKKMKSIRMRVCPPEGIVHISAPHFVTYEEIRRFAAARMDWILRQRTDCVAGVPQYRDGENVALFGKTYRLETLSPEQGPVIELFSETIRFRPSPSWDRDSREKVFNAWYREQLQKKIPELLAIWQPAMGVDAAGGWVVRNMKTRWGSCNVVKKRVCFNLQLAKKPPDCLEYIVVHELAHLLVPNHSKDFYRCMDQFLPDWRRRKKLLENREIPLDLPFPVEGPAQKDN